MTDTSGVTNEMVEAAVSALRITMDSFEDDVRINELTPDEHAYLVRVILCAALAGRVVVPREPTPEIVKAYVAADPRRRRFAASAKRDYRAMIAAAVDGEA